MSRASTWINENVKENHADILQISKLASKMLYDSLSIDIRDPESTIAFYGVVFNTIIDTVASKEDSFSNFELNLANRFAIGYSTTDDDNSEKQGNFMVYLKHLNGVSFDNQYDNENEDDTIVLATRWNAANVVAQPEVIKEISSKALRELQAKLNMTIGSPEVVIPMFCTIHEQVLAYLKLKRIEIGESDYEINLAGLFNVGITQTEEGDEVIYFQPTISLKLKFKNDQIASGKHE